jgi:hypothetical protein
MKYLKKFNENDEFESRLDGSSKSKSDYEKIGSFHKPKSMSDDDFEDSMKGISDMGKGFHVDNHGTESGLVFKLLKGLWNYDDDFLKAVADYFESFDYANNFLNTYDGADGIEDAWERFLNRYDWDEDEINPFSEIN